MKNNLIQFKLFSGMSKLFLFLAFTFCGGVVFSQPQYSISSGSTANTIPTSSSNNQRQCLYLGSDFSTVPAGTITTLYVQASSGSSYSFTTFTVRMGNTTLNSMVTGPWITGLTTVYTGTPFAGSPGTGNWVAIPLQTPFTFSNTQNFIVEISQSGYSPGFSMLYMNSSDRSIFGTTSGTSGSVQARLPNLGFDFSPCIGTPTAPVITTPALTGPICANASTPIAATNTGAASGTSYQWEQATSSTGPWTSVTGGTGATSLNLTTPALNADTWFRVKASCGTNAAPSSAYEVMVSSPIVPGAITGNTSFCAASTEVYSIATVAGATSYNWTLPPGWTGTSTTNTITATTNSTAGFVSVTLTSSCGTSTPSTLAVMPKAAPAQPGIITGDTTPCANSSQTYSVPSFAGATSYTWTLPAGWTGSSTTDSITVTTGTTSGDITVTVSDSCNASSPAQTLAVAVTPSVMPSVTITAVPAGAITPGESVTFTADVINGGTSPQYQWVKNAIDLPGETAATYVTTSLENEDEISVRVISNEDCPTISEVLSNTISVIVNTTGLADRTKNGNSFKIYPNPSTGQFQIDAQFKEEVNGKIRLVIVNTLGQQVYQSEQSTRAINAWSKNIALDNVANGIYYLRITAGDKTSTLQFEIIR